MKKRLITIVLTVILFCVLFPTAMASGRAVRVSPEPAMEYFIVGDFFEGLARVENGGKCGFIDKTGNVVIPLEYDADRYSHFSEGLALVYKGGQYAAASQRIMEGGKCGFVDQSGKVVIPLEYDNATYFSEGLAIVEKNGRQYIINTKGNIVASLNSYYDRFDSFSDGLASVGKDGKYGFINKTGEEVIPVGKYESAWRPFSDGLAVAGKRILIDGGPTYRVEYGFIDKTGVVAIPFEYSFVSTFSDGLAAVRKGGKLGVVDTTGKVVIPLEYDNIGVFSEGLMSFNKDGKQGYMDRDGKVVISLSADYEQASFAGDPLAPFHDGFAVIYGQVRESGSIMDMATYAKWGIIDKTGREIIPLEYDYISSFNEGLALVFTGRADFYHNSFGGKWSIIETVARETIETAGTWAREGITSAISKGFVPEDMQDYYTDTITRAEFCRMAVKWVEYTAGQDVDTILYERGLSRDPDIFSDTNDSDILAAYALGITNGTGGGLFTPEGGFSREQAAAMVMNACRAIGADVSNPPSSGFSDLHSASGWALPGIDFVRANGIMQGTGGNNFSPAATFTREQSIITFNNIIPGALPGL